MDKRRVGIHNRQFPPHHPWTEPFEIYLDLD